MKVFVITKGTEANYRICAVEVDRDAAETLKKVFSRQDNPAKVTEYDTEEHTIEYYKLPMWRVVFNLKAEVESISVFLQEDIENIEIGRDEHIIVYVRAADEEAAKEIAAERRENYLAEIQAYESAWERRGIHEKDTNFI